MPTYPFNICQCKYLTIYIHISRVDDKRCNILHFHNVRFYTINNYAENDMN